jgi:galactose oxidase-like protein/NHL repeat-containing protein/Kelch motif protein
MRRTISIWLLMAAIAAPAAAQSFTATASLHVARAEHAAVLLADGRVLVSGGVGDDGRAIATAEIFDPRRRTWTTAAANRIARFGHAAALLADGRVLIVGGAAARDRCAPTATAEIYDPVADAWQPAADPPFVAGRGTRAAPLDRGRILAIGGDGCGSTAVAAAIFDLAANHWTVTEPAATDAIRAETDAASLRPGAAASRLRESTFLVSGGVDASGTIAIAADLVDTAARSTTPAGVLTVGRSGHTATRLRNGNILIAGGRTFAGATTTAEIYLPEIPYESAPLAAPRTLGPADAVASRSNGHVLLLHPGRMPRTWVVEYAPSDGPVAGAWRPVNELGVPGGNGAPHSIRVDAADNVWVVIWAGAPNRVVEIGSGGDVRMTINEPESRSFLVNPVDVTWDRGGSTFILDGVENSRVLKFDKRGRFVKASSTRPADALIRAHSIAADGAGNLYVADRGNARIAVFDNDLALKASYDNVGNPWALCISPGAHQYLFNATNPEQADLAPSSAGEILKMELDGTIVGRIGRADNSRGTFRTIHHLDCRHEDELLGVAQTSDDWAGFIRLAPRN